MEHEGHNLGMKQRRRKLLRTQRCDERFVFLLLRPKYVHRSKFITNKHTHTRTNFQKNNHKWKMETVPIQQTRKHTTLPLQHPITSIIFFPSSLLYIPSVCLSVCLSTHQQSPPRTQNENQFKETHSRMRICIHRLEDRGIHHDHNSSIRLLFRVSPC